ncbi:site-specific DNA-methyltransferase [Acinetobacter baumannii]|uniref:site-specific DNA-methyltransferase n=1 Tax=Acinetobacter baumannii TaxID=470 RepID=UPI00066E6822|nr:site-specific DNA-methyltransferase [Acinetobacter baumannii]KMV26330.1 DNA methylase family protein [Acinetobacter baumannii]MDI9657049.1 site-specific DNA-methyltransferase [Acinetobacter baumannii]MDI9668122.1 site-specific DNA-methyltransferase [Acinetobacter baumannii]MDI9809788.1 site-specific DNA-methyltransferase [Acinetobacter baumannii]MDI9811493.1 site-specific DNA-methyltransferase [Acinetobacter baumannii]
MTTQFSALVSKLKEIFQINRPDLDFGVYRILNARSAEIAEFLDKRLKTKVEQYLGEAKSSLDENVLKELEAELKAEFGKRAFNEQGQLIDAEAIESALGQKYIALTQADAHEMTDQSQVYSHLLTFFSRYYDDGDFISQRRYKGDTYAIPYSGEEVMLHWANKDQYYTKSGEMFSNYRFKLNDERSVLFRLVSADTARENRKDNDKDRRFIIVTEPKTFTRIDEDGEEFEETIVPFSIQNNELTILFEYATLPKGSKQETLNIESYNKIVSAEVLTTDWLNDLAQPAPTEKEPKRTVLHKHLSTYTQKNTADYFIHKDLGKFLRHELDFYIKNEVMHLDDVVNTDQFIQIERQLSIIKCLRQIGLEIISFLASLEDFQKKLWLKKKFVVSAEYCITLDRVDESLYAEIADNTAQWQQWEDLGFKGKEAGWGTVDYLKQHQALMVDTSLFSLEFKAKLLKRIDDLDAQTDGLIINSDNFQALSLLGEKYKQLVGCIYIDPPYNAKSSEILYKNTFKHSAFLTFISNRLEVAKPFLQSGGLLNIAIDDYEQKGVITVCDEIYGSNNFISNVVVQHNPRGRNDDKFYGTSHEYMIVYTNNIENANLGNFTLSDEDKSIYRLSDTISKYQEVSFMRTGNNSDRVTRPNLFYPIYLNKKTNMLSLDKSDDSIEILPINSSKEEKTWRWERKTFLERKDTEVSFKISEDGVRLYKKRRLLDVGKKPKTIWFDSKYDASSSGIMFLRNFFSKDNHEFSYPKSIYTVKDAVYISSSKNGVVLDYFAGSGTTAHATIALNREDNGNRKYILVEQGEYFDTVIKPRIQKVVYSADWKDGKPTNPESGISHCLKVVKLESYEDTLNNLELVRKGAQQTLLAEQKTSTKPDDQNAYSDYLMHYMLELESKESLLNVKDFLKPFSYQMNITTDSAGAFERKTIDLVETFNYLIGMNVQEVDYQLDKGYAQITGKLRTGEYTTVLWRDCEKIGYAELDQLLAKLKINPNDGEYQLIYINGDHNVASKYTTKEGEEKQLKVRSIEQTFLKNMFEE